MSSPMPPVMSYGHDSDLLVLSKIADGFANTNQNLCGGFANTNQNICQATATVLAGTERQNLNLLTSTERNGSDVRLAVERNGNDTRTVVNGTSVANQLSTERNGNDTRAAVERNGASGIFTTERNGGDTRMSVVQQASDIKGAVADSRSLIQNSIRDSTQWLGQADAATLAAVERNASENRAVTTTEAATGRIQSSANFSEVRSSISKEAGDIKYQSAQHTNELASLTASAAQANALAAKDIQIQQLAVKADLALQAANNFSTSRMDTFQGVKSVQEQLCRSELDAYKHKESLAAQMTAQTSLNHLAIKAAELEAYKHKEALSQQLQRAEVEAVKAAALAAKQLSDCCCEIKEKISSTSAQAQLEAFKIAAAAQKAQDDCCCELKEKVDARATMTELLIKREVENKLRDDNIVARLGGSGSALAVPAAYGGYPGGGPGYGGGPPFPGAWGGAFPGYGGGGYPGYGPGYPGVVPVVEVGGRRRERSCSPRRGRDGRDGRDADDHHSRHGPA